MTIARARPGMTGYLENPAGGDKGEMMQLETTRVTGTGAGS